MTNIALALIASVALFLGILVAENVGRRIGLRRAAVAGSAAVAGTGAIDASVFALLGLLIAFTFSGAGARFDVRRQLIVEEANDIGTAYLRLDILPPASQAVLRESFRDYLDARIATYRKLPDLSAARAEQARASDLQAQIWKQAVAATQAPDAPPSAALLVLPSLNAMFDITTTRTMATLMHPPLMILGTLIVLTLAASLLAGYGTAALSAHPRLHMLLFAAVMAVAVYVILDLEFPRFGLMRVDAFDEALVALRETMK